MSEDTPTVFSERYDEDPLKNVGGAPRALGAGVFAIVAVVSVAGAYLGHGAAVSLHYGLTCAAVFLAWQLRDIYGGVLN